MGRLGLESKKTGKLSCCLIVLLLMVWIMVVVAMGTVGLI